jgi:hypothetical protein
MACIDLEKEAWDIARFFLMNKPNKGCSITSPLRNSSAISKIYDMYTILRASIDGYVDVKELKAGRAPPGDCAGGRRITFVMRYQPIVPCRISYLVGNDGEKSPVRRTSHQNRHYSFLSLRLVFFLGRQRVW